MLCPLSGGASGQLRRRPPEGSFAAELLPCWSNSVAPRPPVPSAPGAGAATLDIFHSQSRPRREGAGTRVGRLRASRPPKRRRCRTSGTGLGASRPSRAIGSATVAVPARRQTRSHQPGYFFLWPEAFLYRFQVLTDDGASGAYRPKWPRRGGSVDWPVADAPVPGGICSAEAPAV